MGKVRVIFPDALTKVTGGEKETEISASSLNEALQVLVAKYGDAFKERIFDSSGGLRRFLNFYVNGKNILHLSEAETRLEDGDEVSILPAVAGG